MYFWTLKIIYNGINIRLLWTHAHVGSVGNEHADTLVKDAINNVNVDLIVDLDKNIIRKKVSNHVIKICNTWDYIRIVSQIIENL